jgi:transcriptional regulator with XRE-family HTH domain
MSFKENLRSELDYQDITVKELAVRSGLNKRTLDNYFTGHNSIPPADVAVKIAQALGVTVEYLVTGKSLPMGEKFIPSKIRKIVDKMLMLDEMDVDSVIVLIESMMKRYN